MPHVHIEMSEALDTALEARRHATGARSKRSCALAILRDALAPELKIAEETTGKVDESSPTLNHVWRATLRKLGNSEAERVADEQKIDIIQARQLSRMQVELYFDSLVDAGKIPANVSFKPFLTGWRGPIRYQHGVYNCYAKGCRCEACRVAWRLYKRNRAKAKRSRLQAAVMKPFEQGTAEMIAKIERQQHEHEDATGDSQFMKNVKSRQQIELEQRQALERFQLQGEK